MKNLLPDARYALRQIVRAPVFTGISLLLLAVGIGVNAALFSIIDTRIAHPKAGIENVEGLVNVEIRPANPQMFRSLFLEEFLVLREQQSVFQDMGAVASGGTATIDLAGDQSRANILFATGGFFSVLQPRMTLGAAFPRVADRGAPADPVAVVSYLYWRSRLGGDTTIVGRTIRVNRVPITIVGVLPRGFDPPSSVPHNMDLWLPLSAHDLIFPPRPAASGPPQTLSTATAVPTRPQGQSLADPVARLRAGVTIEQATAAATAIVAGIAGTYWPQNPLGGVSLREVGHGSEFVTGSAIIGNVTLLILLIACANISILLLGRAVKRRREIAVRLALGARRSRVVGMLLVESVLLSLAACAGGLLVAQWIVEFFNARFPFMGMDYALSWRSVSATILFAAGTGILFGLTPAMHATRADVGDALKAGASATDRGRTRLQRAFVVAEVAMSMALVCAAWLFVQAFGAMHGGRPYEVSQKVLIASLEFSELTGTASYSATRQSAFLSDLYARVSARPGVEVVSFGNAHPLGVDRVGYRLIGLPGSDGLPAAAGSVAAALGAVDPDYFRAAGIRVRDGREFARSDSAGATPVVVVATDVAERLWPGRSAVGNVVSIGVRRQAAPGEAADTVFQTYSVAGVVDPVRSFARMGTSYGRPVGTIYVPRLQLAPGSGQASGSTTLVVRTAGSARDHTQAIVQQIRALDPELPLTGVGTTADRHFELSKEEISMSNGIALAGLVSLFMACVGVYAVIAFGVHQRTREIGIRMALGARRSQVVALFFRDGMRLAVIGFVIGVPVSLIVMKLALGDEAAGILAPAAVTTVALVLLAVAALASWIPARRAASVDPMEAARSD